MQPSHERLDCAKVLKVQNSWSHEDGGSDAGIALPQRYREHRTVTAPRFSPSTAGMRLLPDRSPVGMFPLPPEPHARDFEANHARGSVSDPDQLDGHDSFGGTTANLSSVHKKVGLRTGRQFS